MAAMVSTLPPDHKARQCPPDAGGLTDRGQASSAMHAHFEACPPHHRPPPGPILKLYQIPFMISSAQKKLNLSYY